MPDAAAVARLTADGYLSGPPGAERTTPRWQAALARAAATMQRRGEPWRGLKAPVALALLERDPDVGDEELAAMVEALAELEAAALPWLEPGEVQDVR
jgi:hypothetical protein